MNLTSSAFLHGGAIPAVYTGEGGDLSPPLHWSGAPEGTRSFVLIVDDPDAPDPAHPRTTWVHWLLYNLPGTCSGLEAGAPRLPDGALQGRNDWQRPSYGGPSPPIGRHRYFFKLYALDTVLPDLAAPAKAALEQAMQGHVMARAELIGTYQSRKRHGGSRG